jgi:hypothetical protein
MAPGLGLCLYALGFDSWRYVRGSDAESWPVAAGRLESSGFRDVEGRRSAFNPRRRYDPDNVVTLYEPVVEYSYVVNGARYTGDRIWLIGRVQRWETPEQVEYFVNGLQPSALRVRYNPDDLADSTLFVHSAAVPGFWTSLVSVPIGLAFAWPGWAVLRSARRNRPISK